MYYLKKKKKCNESCKKSVKLDSFALYLRIFYTNQNLKYLLNEQAGLIEMDRKLYA